MLSATTAYADEIRPAYLQISELAESQFDVLWKVPTLGSDKRLSLSVSFDADTHVTSAIIDGTNGGYYSQRWRIQRAGGLADAAISIEGQARSATEVLLRIEYADGATLTDRITPDNPFYQVDSRPTQWQTAWTYFGLGVEHILVGLDHLLFVVALLLLVSGVRRLVATITAFTLAHSITLVLSSLQLVSLPVPPVEACIALSIVFVASEILHGLSGRPGLSVRRPWVVAFSFGLLHGLGFAAVLMDIGLPQQALGMALLTFNVGVEVGQLLFVSALLLLWQLYKHFFAAPGLMLQRFPAYVIGSLASFWLIERVLSFWV